MTPFRVLLPPACRKEAAWTVQVILGEFLGLPVELGETGGEGVRIMGGGRELVVSSPLLAALDRAWLDPERLPSPPFDLWDCSDLDPGGRVARPLEVISGAPRIEVDAGDGASRLHLDVFGVAFLLLSGYEEHVVRERDRHGRFPAAASLAVRGGFLGRPIVDEYVEVLWAAMRRIWPGLSRRRWEAGVRVSCDVDHPYSAYTRSLPRTVRKAAGDVLKRRDPLAALTTVGNALATRVSIHGLEPNDTFRWIMDVNEAAGNVVTFHFVARRRHPVFDPEYDLGERRIRRLLRRIHERGHEIALHGSYLSGEGEGALAGELARLNAVLAEESIAREVTSNRQHYLRWIPGETASLLDRAGIEYDSTLGYAELPGFRCGTAREYPMYDVGTRRPLKLKQRPLLLMEDSVLDPQYMGLGASDSAHEVMAGIREASRVVGGQFTLLWHNSSLGTNRLRDLYRALVS